MDLKKYIRAVPDFPQPGILFRDITPLLNYPPAFQEVIAQLIELTKKSSADVVVGIESRGFIFGAPISAALGLPFVPVRKPGKLPAEVVSVKYSLEYGSGQLDIHRDAMKPGARAVIIDDLLATGGTALAASQLIEKLGGSVAQFLFVIELEALGGRKILGAQKAPITALLNY